MPTVENVTWTTDVTRFGLDRLSIRILCEESNRSAHVMLNKLVYLNDEFSYKQRDRSSTNITQRYTT